MSHQLTFADSEFSSKRRQTRKEIFLSRMEQILPWQNMVEVIEPFYPKAGNGRNAVHLSGAALRFTGKRVFDIFTALGLDGLGRFSMNMTPMQ
ncbi:hypothetical protein VCX44_24770, partial [Aeromonas caviae]|nr:hypothetical protein [Aeromonas caviae]